METTRQSGVAAPPLGEVVYSPESDIKHPARLLMNMWRDLLASRELAWRLFLRDIRGQYRQSLLGYLWVFIPPVVTTAIWVFLKGQGVVAVSDTDVPYAAYVLTGTLLWGGFVAAILAPITFVTEATKLLGKINFPRESLLLAALGKVLFNLTISLLLLAAVYLWFGVDVPVTILLMPVGLLVLVGFGFAIGLWLLPLSMLFTDVGRAVGPVTQVWFFLTPIVYAAPTSGPAALLARANPVSPLLIATRQMATTGQVARPGDFLIMAAVTALALAAGWVLYRVAMPHLIARMAA